MDATPTPCVLIIEASTKLYQTEARARFSGYMAQSISPWTWITTTCGYQCINPDHMICHSPVKILYPAGVCVYCGFPAGTKDHLLPKPLTGSARRSLVAVVPACASCNSRIGAFPSASIEDRQARAHDSIRRSKRKVLLAPDRTREDIASFGPGLRPFIEAKAREKEVILAQLAWPEDPFYDIRAFQKSGIPDPAALGLVSAFEESKNPAR